MAELVDACDSKSHGKPCRFESDYRHIFNIFNRSQVTASQPRHGGMGRQLLTALATQHPTRNRFGSSPTTGIFFIFSIFNYFKNDTTRANIDNLVGFILEFKLKEFKRILATKGINNLEDPDNFIYAIVPIKRKNVAKLLKINVKQGLIDKFLSTIFQAF